MDIKTAMYLLSVIVTILVSSVDSDIVFSPTSETIHENHNALYNLSEVSATCTAHVQETYACSRSTRQPCSMYNYQNCYTTIYSTCYRRKAESNVVCNECSITSDPSEHFTMSGSVIQKKECSDKYCNPCSTPGCLNGGESFTITVTCKSTGYYENGQVSGTFTVTVTKANGPTFKYKYGNSINVSHDNAPVGTVINRLEGDLVDNVNDVDMAYYRKESGPEDSYIYNTADLFILNIDTGEVIINKDLTTEYSYTFTMNLCVYDRRGREECEDLTIKLWACFQIPNCKDQTKLDVLDTFGTYTNGHGGDSNTLFNMIYDPPSEHFFDNFSTQWHNLNWTFDRNDLEEADINVDTGEIFITRNISIWPAWPTKYFTQIVRVTNSESCITSTCTFDIQVHYTNWPIEICKSTVISLPENHDSEAIICNIITCDYNYESEDNVTCNMTDWSPKENNLFELRDDGNHAFDSYKVYKRECSKPNCGYKYQEPTPYYCDTDTGCLTHNRTQQYSITIQCNDGYNSSDTVNLTFNVIKNEAPAYKHLPTHIDLNRQNVSHLDTIFEIIYTDKENDGLIFEYNYTDIDTSLETTYFVGDSTGNTHNNMANITMTTFLADKEVNKTYNIHICGHDRRNERCTDLTIDIEEYCSESPKCSDSSSTTDTELAIGSELFDISSLVNGAFGGLSYGITSQHVSLFSVDSTTGQVTIAGKFEEIFDSATYSITAFVYNQGSCWYGQCQLTVKVIAINYAIEITNLPATVSVLEDMAGDEIVTKVEVDDDNENDPYTCGIVNTNSVEPFYLERIPVVSGEYFIKNQEEGVLSSATTTYSVSIECTDSHGGSDTEVLTITVTLNQAPVFTNFTADSTQGISADPMDFNVGDTLHTVTATDNEGDQLTFSCTISNSLVPYECESEATEVHLKIRRDLRIDDDNGQTYSVQICLRDAKHSDQCGTLDVTFTRVKTRPEITNLPDTKSFNEDTAVGTTLFEPTIRDPDTGESHRFTMRVKPVSESSIFNLNTLSGALTLVQPFDYERTTNYMFTYMVKDNYLDSLTDKTLKIHVVNVNEGTTISASPTSISFYEDMVADGELSGPEFSCSDIEGDATSYEILSGAHKDYFSIDSGSGKITLVNEWDLESTGALPTSTILTIGCKDTGGLSSTVDIAINIEDANDKSPNLNVITGSSPISITSTTCLCSDLMSFAASDSDFSDDNDFEFSVLGNGIGFEYFRMLKTGPTTATLKPKKTLPYKNDKTFSISVKVCDGESSPLCDVITVAFNYTAADPDEFKAKESARCLTCTGIGRTVVTVICIEGVFVVGFILHILYSCYLTKTIDVRQILKSRKIRSTSFKQDIRPSKKERPNLLRNRIARSNAIEMRRTETHKDRTREDDSTSDTSSSSSDSENDNRIRRLNVRVQRSMVPSSQRGHDLDAAESGLPSPVYSNRVNSAGQRPIVSARGIQPGFIV